MIEEAVKEQVSLQGMNVEKVEEQISNFINGFPALPIEEAAAIGNGIQTVTNDEIERYLKEYPSKCAEKEIVKFVPASGAATRMFKDLFSYLSADDKSLDNNPFVKKFISNLKSFAFYNDLETKLLENNLNIHTLIEKEEYTTIISWLLDDKGLGYGNLPKGLLKFHRYDDGSRTPVYEHFSEGIQYGLGKGNTVRLHFTVSPEHQDRFEDKVNYLKKFLSNKFNINFEVSFSQQKKSTDTIAVNMDNTPFVEENGEILFRPAGHGALLENLNEVDADIIFIKNIDNVVPDHLKEVTRKYKIAIASILLETQEKLFSILANLGESSNPDNISTASAFLENKLGHRLPHSFSSLEDDDKVQYLKSKLDRPLRVCGMVENTGEPGGGPFWVNDNDGSVSLQIGETAQLDLEDKKHANILKSSTHFNPTDLVCGVKNYKGEKFDLLKYRDPSTGFITFKSKNGKDLKAQELPGLWNGSMADWNSIFVEVPLETFNPVKTINDLLREQHQ
ncbi:DUF4301 family protein [Echinicola sp. CAU 1574]|uniref:DUF4301 family protein n=1 Tax=Echinicola arenosa TaxID=2774144 RepID=A0ABR9ANY4_9BACT|nr:DUF4301 family protein [Echinicola arenosa]MBD8490512.1 DUF4301 family protein [Echinicola arenosa]